MLPFCLVCQFVDYLVSFKNHYETVRFEPGLTEYLSKTDCKISEVKNQHGQPAGLKYRSQVTGYRSQVTGQKNETFGGYVLRPKMMNKTCCG